METSKLVHQNSNSGCTKSARKEITTQYLLSAVMPVDEY